MQMNVCLVMIRNCLQLVYYILLHSVENRNGQFFVTISFSSNANIYCRWATVSKNAILVQLFTTYNSNTRQMVRKYISFSTDSQINRQFIKLRAISVFSSSHQIAMYTMYCRPPLLSPYFFIACICIESVLMKITNVIYLNELDKNNGQFERNMFYSTIQHIKQIFKYNYFNLNLIILQNILLVHLFSQPSGYYFHLFHFNLIFISMNHSINSNKSSSFSFEKKRRKKYLYSKKIFYQVFFIIL